MGGEVFPCKVSEGTVERTRLVTKVPCFESVRGHLRYYRYKVQEVIKVKSDLGIVIFGVVRLNRMSLQRNTVLKIQGYRRTETQGRETRVSLIERFFYEGTRDK